MPASDETITSIEPFDGLEEGEYMREAGFKIHTTAQTITLAIDDESSCCESWGYFLTEDDTSKFVGAVLRGVRITDENRSGRIFMSGYGDVQGDSRPVEHLDEGGVMFVDIETDRGSLQFVAYNAHNGYYGHEARVSSVQLQHRETL